MAKHLHAPELTDEVIEAAFCGTNFGRTDYRDFLAHSVLKKACDWHCGYTITCIMVNLKLITPKTHKVTKLGKVFLTDSYPDPLREARDAPPSPVKLPEPFNVFKQAGGVDVAVRSQVTKNHLFGIGYNACIEEVLRLNAIDNTAQQYEALAGWKMVPVEPTAEMYDAGDKQLATKQVWDAMLAAAPKPEGQ